MGTTADDEAPIGRHSALLDGLEQIRRTYLLPHEYDPDPSRTARRFWAEVIQAVGEGRVLEPALAAHAVQCLKNCLDQPERSAYWLGLVGNVGAPEKLAERLELGRLVQYFVDQGLPRKSEADDGLANDAIQAVADLQKKSRSTVIQADRYYRKLPKRDLLDEAVPLPPKRAKADGNSGSDGRP